MRCPDAIGALLGIVSISESRAEAENLIRRVVRLDPSHAGAQAALASLVSPIEQTRRG